MVSLRHKGKFYFFIKLFVPMSCYVSRCFVLFLSYLVKLLCIQFLRQTFILLIANIQRENGHLSG